MKSDELWVTSEKHRIKDYGLWSKGRDIRPSLEPRIDSRKTVKDREARTECCLLITENFLSCQLQCVT